MQAFVIKKGATYPALTVQLLDNAGAAVNLTTAASVYFTMENVHSGVKKINHAAAVISSATEGIVKYNWIAGDVDTVGEYLGEFEITWADGKKFFTPVEQLLQINIVDVL